MVEWAFCGTSHTSPAFTENGIGKPQHSSWHHWIDSRNIELEPDEGDMWPQENGDVLEKGCMRHPTSGKKVAYEELWADIVILPIRSHSKNTAERKCVVLKSDSDGTKGLIIRVGQYIQGMMRSSEGLRLVQFEWQARPSQGDEVGVWTKTLSLGRGHIPYMKIINGLNIKVGECIEGCWELLEDFTW